MKIVQPRYLKSYFVKRFFYILILVVAVLSLFFANSFMKSNFLRADVVDYPDSDFFNRIADTELVSRQVAEAKEGDLEQRISDSLEVVDDKISAVDNPPVKPIFAATTSAPTVSSAPVEKSLSYPYDQSFLISAYYSPLPCQSKYVTGSYEGDIRLNGGGVNGADGTPVFPGMIAAPKSYPFGMKMYIEGLGTGAVHDRGGAIVAGHSSGYDRLDVWMGYGDEGMKRALNWGKRVVNVNVYGIAPDIATQMTFSTPKPSSDCAVSPSSAPDVSVKPPAVSLPSPSADQSVAPKDFSGELDPGDKGPAVEKLQQELITLNFLKTKKTGVYDEVTAHAVFKFQQSQRILSSKTEKGAGRFGPATRAALHKIIDSRQNMSSKMLKSSSPVNDGAFLVYELDFGVTDPAVGKLQQFLKSKGYFDHAVTNYFGEVTLAALIEFQIDNGLITNASSKGAGRVGPGTLRLINSQVSV